MEQICLLNRKTQQITVEQPPAEKGLIWLYKDSFVSRIAKKVLTHSPKLSSFYAFFQNSRLSRRSIQPFIEKYKIDDNEFLEPISQYKSFNAFFQRKLKPGARIIDERPNYFTSPADGRLKILKDLTDFEIKGSHFDLQKFLSDKNLYCRFHDCQLVAIRLAPDDYHRLHAPLDATCTQILHVDGPLYSVSPIALRKKWSILNENKRIIIDFEDFLLVLVGATFVGSMHLNIKPQDFVRKGEEIGWFSFGGSMCICCLKPHVAIDEDLFYPHGEVLVRMGESIASFSLSEEV
jgi:phosphatidylserine decarboxylase